MRTLLRLAALSLAALLIGAALSVASVPTEADAATKNAGIPGLTPYGGYLGNYLAPDGTRVYCIDSPLPWPSGETSGPTLVDSLVTTWGAPLSADSLRKLNYVLLTYGQTDDQVQAAAVAAYVNAHTSGWARDLGVGYAAGAWYLNGNAIVTPAYDAIWADAEANAIPTATATATIELGNSTSGVVRVAASVPGATGSVALHGAVAASSGATEIAVDADDEIAVRGVPSDDERSYSISATVSYTAPTTAAANLTLYTTPGQQRTIRGGGPDSIAFSATAATEAILLDFAPVITTRVTEEIVEVGEPFVDSVTVSLAEGSRPWRLRTDGTAVPVQATGVLYGPFSEQPAVSAAPPADAPAVGIETLTLAGAGEYLTSGSLLAAAPGYYTWVWTIDATSAPESLPEGYTHTTEFGLVAETHRVPEVPPASPAPTETPTPTPAPTETTTPVPSETVAPAPTASPTAQQLARTGTEAPPVALLGAGLLLVGLLLGISARARRWH